MALVTLLFLDWVRGSFHRIPVGFWWMMLSSLVPVIFLGEDGHLASLFPPVIDSGFSSAKVCISLHVVSISKIPKKETDWNTHYFQYAVHTTTERFAIFDRITVTMPVIEQSKNKVPPWSAFNCQDFLPEGREQAARVEGNGGGGNEPEKVRTFWVQFKFQLRWPAHCLLRHESTLAMFTP